MQRNREIELRRSLREIRTAIDKYKDATDQNLISTERHRQRRRRLSADARHARAGRDACERHDRPESCGFCAASRTTR
jgi:hypothetical protein